MVGPVPRFGVCFGIVEFFLSRPVTRRFRLLCTQVPLGSGEKHQALALNEPVISVW